MKTIASSQSRYSLPRRSSSFFVCVIIGFTFDGWCFPNKAASLWRRACLESS